MFREISVWHVVLILIAFMVLFGYKKLPDATRSLGRSMRIFKSEVKGLHDDDTRTETRTDARNETSADAPKQVGSAAPRPETTDRVAEPTRSTESRVESDRT
jgi:sec-independent protein translocase protein TatA